LTTARPLRYSEKRPVDARAGWKTGGKRCALISRRYPPLRPAASGSPCRFPNPTIWVFRRVRTQDVVFGQGKLRHTI